MKKIIFVLLSSFVLIGCSVQRGENPKVSLVDVTFSDVTIFETSAEFIVRIENPNPFSVTIDGASHDLFINGIEIGRGLSDEKIEVARLGTATQRVKVRLSNLSIVRNVQSLVDKKDFDYRIDSKLYIPGSFGLSSYSVSNSGRFASF